MLDWVPPLLDWIRQPEYTGENRCVPCTVVNVGIAVVASTLIAFVAIEFAVGVLVLSLLAIYFRGYLVPGTPTLTERFLPDRVLALFEHDESPKPKSSVTEPETWETIEKIEYERENSVEPEQFLIDVAAVRRCDDGGGGGGGAVTDLRLTDEFLALVERRLEPYRDEPVDSADIANLFDTDPDDVTFQDREYPAIKVGRRIRKWPADGALVADLAANEAFGELTDRWSDVPLEQRIDTLELVRSLRETCPICEGDVDVSADTVESCCRSYEVVTVGCVDCEERLVELDPELVENGTVDTGIRP